jgi:hypothetical protein
MIKRMKFKAKYPSKKVKKERGKKEGVKLHNLQKTLQVILKRRSH